MKKRIFTLVLLMIGIGHYVKAQESFIVPADSVLNEFMANNKAESGTSTYVLARDGYYIISGAMSPSGDVAIVAADGAGARPVIIHGVDDAGATLGWGMMWAGGSITFKGLNIKPTNILGKRGPWHTAIGNTSGPEVSLIYDDCIIEFSDGASIWDEASTKINMLKITNCMFRWNGTNNGGKWQGFACLIKNGSLETAVIENNTFFENYAPLFIHENGHVKNVFFNHNTIVSNAQAPIRFNYADRIVCMNNLFVDAPFGQERPSDLLTDPEQQPMGVYTIDFYRVDSVKPEGYPTEDKRINVIAYNANYLSPEVKAFINLEDTLKYAPLANGNGFLNTRALNMMKSEGDFDYPYFKWDDNLSVFTENPEFTNVPIKVEEEILMAKHMLGDTIVVLSTENGQWGRFPEKGEDLTAAAPLPKEYYNFAYTNAKYLTAASAGYPLGDLNWFADKKSQWQNDANKEDYNKIIASVLDGTWEFANSTAVPSYKASSLSARCQNPVHGSALLTYSLPQAGKVSIELYDIFGKKVASIVANQTLNAGEHTATIDASGLASGTYFYKITAGNGVYTQKIAVIE